MSITEPVAPLTLPLDPVLDAGPAPYKIGLIALSTDMVTERDFSLMLPPGDEVMYYTARVPNVCPVTVENPAPHGAAPGRSRGADPADDAARRDRL